MYSTTLSSKWEHPWKAYTRHLPRYRNRKLSHESDLINGITGILDALYPKGDVYYGLPLPELDLALLWTSKTEWSASSQEKVCALFPSWSWTSSSGEVPGIYKLVNLEFDFCASLCLWFRPVPTNESSLELQVISANTNAPSTCSDSTGSVTDDSLGSHIVKALKYGLVEPWEDDHPSRSDKPSSELERLLVDQWQNYPDFWNDVFGRADVIDRARQKLDGLKNKLRDDILVTRTQITSLKILGSGSEERIINDANQQVGWWYINDNNNQIADLRQKGQEIFELIALSISVSAVDVTRIDMFEDSEGYLPKILPVVNAMIVRKQGDYYYRIGLTKILMKYWGELKAPFETVMLA